MRSSLRINVIANMVGKVSSMLLAIIFTPVYIRYLGVEAYGLIGFYITLQASVSFLEMGLSRSCNRELARYSGLGAHGHESMNNTLRTLEIIYWSVAIVLGVVLSVSASWVATSWISSAEFSKAQLTYVVILMAWVIALRWPVGLYTGALMGLQRQVRMNVIQTIVSVFNWGGAAIMLWLVRPDIEIFFQWQLFVAICSAVGFVFFTWECMPGSFSHGNYSYPLLKLILPFSASVGGNAVLGTLLRQADKLILSSMLPLKQFAYYTLASVIANVAAMLANPVSNAVFPKFSQMIGGNVHESRISALYHLASQLVSAMIVPFSLVVAVFSEEVLLAYTGEVELAKNASTVLTILALSKLLHASMAVPYALQLSYGWVKLSIYINIVSIIWLIPAIYWFAGIYGPIGAALAWFVVTVGYVVIGIPLMHGKLLVGEGGRWIWKTTIAPITIVGVFLSIVYWLVAGSSFGHYQQILLFLGCATVSLVLTVFVAHDARSWVLNYLNKWAKS